MLTVREVVEAAYEEVGALDPSDGATISQLERGLAGFQGLMDGWIGSGMFGRFTDAISDGALTITAGGRVRLNPSASGSITLSDPVDGEAPSNRAVARVSDPVLGHTATLIYDANAGRWLQAGSLSLDDPAPLSNLGPGLISCLAEVVAKRTPGASISPLTARDAARFRTSLATGFDSPRQAVSTEFSAWM